MQELVIHALFQGTQGSSSILCGKTGETAKVMSAEVDDNAHRVVYMGFQNKYEDLYDLRS
jgi:hypothetical protein